MSGGAHLTDQPHRGQCPLTAKAVVYVKSRAWNIEADVPRDGRLRTFRLEQAARLLLVDAKKPNKVPINSREPREVALRAIRPCPRRLQLMRAFCRAPQRDRGGTRVKKRVLGDVSVSVVA